RSPDRNAHGALAGKPGGLEPVAGRAARTHAGTPAAFLRAAPAVRIPSGTADRLPAPAQGATGATDLVSCRGSVAGRRAAASLFDCLRLRLLSARHRDAAARGLFPHEPDRHGEPRSCDVVPSSSARGRLVAV